jgi:hypothetical protein
VKRAIFMAPALALAACSFLQEQVSINSTSDCIRKECKDPNAADYTRCEAACRNTYSR